MDCKPKASTKSTATPVLTTHCPCCWAVKAKPSGRAFGPALTAEVERTEPSEFSARTASACRRTRMASGHVIRSGNVMPRPPKMGRHIWSFATKLQSARFGHPATELPRPKIFEVFFVLVFVSVKNSDHLCRYETTSKPARILAALSPPATLQSPVDETPTRNQPGTSPADSSRRNETRRTRRTRRTR